MVGAVPATAAVDRLRSSGVVSIKLNRWHVWKTSGPGRRPVKDASEFVTDHPALRFAIAAFDTWAGAQTALHALNAGGKALNNVSYLAQLHVLADAVTSDGRQTVHLFGGPAGGLAARQDRLRIALPGGLPLGPRR